MTDTTAAVLAVMLYLEIKHFVCDYPLQTHYQLVNKGTYGHPGGILHSGIHALFTIPAFLLITPSLGVVIGIIVGEFLIHYHVDWAKQQIMAHTGWQSGDRHLLRRVSPHLRPWDELSEDARQYDREAVRTIDAALAAAGWGVTRA